MHTSPLRPPSGVIGCTPGPGALLTTQLAQAEGKGRRCALRLPSPPGFCCVHAVCMFEPVGKLSLAAPGNCLLDFVRSLQHGQGQQRARSA